MADDGDYDDAGGDGGMEDYLDEDEFVEEDQDADADQNTQANQQQLQGDDRMEILNEEDLVATQSGMKTDPSKRITNTIYDKI